MAEIAHIIAPTDFSRAADRATRRAASLASTLDSVLHLVHVLPPHDVLEQIFPAPFGKEVEAFQAHAEQLLNERVRRIRAQFGITPERRVVRGRARQAILDAVESIDADLIVLGAQGEREGVPQSSTVGATALKIAEQSRVPTLLVRREAHERYRHIVACAKGQPIDRDTVEWASSLSPTDLLHILSVYEVPYEPRLIDWGASHATIDAYAARERDKRMEYLSELVSALGLPAEHVRLHIERGEPLQAILRAAARFQAGLIVAGRRAQMDSLSAGPFGSVARRIAFRAPMDVMIVPPAVRSA